MCRPSLVNDKRIDGSTPLHTAVANNLVNIVQLLIILGRADVNAVDSMHRTPLHVAVIHRHVRILQVLLEAGANVNKVDGNGDTALHLIMKKCSFSDLKEIRRCIEAFVESDVRLNALRVSSCNPTAAMAKLLIANGADWKIRNHVGSTVADVFADSKVDRSQLMMFNYAVSECASMDMIHKLDLRFKRLSINLPWPTCALCMSRPRDVLFLPCKHICTCISCSDLLKSCMHCRGRIESTVQINECVVCSSLKACTLFLPCGHVCACNGCALLMKKCAQCRMTIEVTELLMCAPSNVSVRRGSCNSRSKDSCHNAVPRLLNNGEEDTGSECDEVLRLRQQLQDIKDQTACPVCFDRDKNMVFFCGHGCCQLCGDRMMECPICRTPIDRRILTYN